MSDKPRLNVVLYWHMHQPEYRDLRTGEYHLPWTYLHTIKDYVDMAAQLEANPSARAVVNFAPVLLEQIDDYASQLKGYLKRGQAIKDPLLSALAGPVIPKNSQKRISLVKDCLRANEARLVDRFPPFRMLVDMAKQALDQPTMMHYYDDQFIVDLLVWYHLAWIGETVRRKDARVKQLMNKARIFSMHDRRLLIELIGELVGSVIGRYRKLAEAGRVELSMTPYAHPIVPLLLDIESAREAMHDVHLPIVRQYPGGEERSRWHMKKGLQTFEHYFGFRPQGCWPSEGSVSDATVKLIADMGMRWVASGETVLRNSLLQSGMDAHHCIHTAYKFDGTEARCFFRDDGLSDLIGFKYSEWHADDAVANLIHHLENIASACDHQEDAIASIILDGENAWEYYPENGYYFLNALYEKLVEHEAINLTTYSEYLDRFDQPAELPNLVAGSWVYGTFSTWIGDRDKNRAWDMLADAKQVYDRVVASGHMSDKELQRAELQLAICEGSDWFWWFGDYNPADSVSSFDEQYRLHLGNLYTLLGEEPPEYLSHSFSQGSGSPAMGGVMLPGKQAN
jgi:alpha-amylase/alpha-mannosidase (GH57 family)